MINPRRMLLLTLLYYSVALFNQQFLLIRAGLAAALYIYGTSHFVRGNRTSFVLSGVLAYLVHESSIVPFVLTYLLNRSLSPKVTAFLLALAVIGNVFKYYLLAGLGFFVRSSGSRYSEYLYEGSEYIRESGVINTAFFVLLFLFVYLYVRFGRPIRLVAKRESEDQQDSPLRAMVRVNTMARVNKSNGIATVFMNLAIVFVVVNIAFPFSGIVPRLNLYLLMPVWIFMIYVSTVATWHIRVSLNVLIVLYSLIAIYTLAFSPDLFIYRTYESWLLDPSLNFDTCSTIGQY